MIPQRNQLLEFKRQREVTDYKSKYFNKLLSSQMPEIIRVQ